MTTAEMDFPEYYAELQRTNQLDCLLDPHPEIAAARMIETITHSPEPTVHNIHAKSMFAGKSTAALEVAKQLIELGLPTVAYQPTTAIRYGSAQKVSLITNGGLSFPAILTPPRLEAVYDDLKSRPQQPELVIIDEAMMYIDNAHDREGAIQIIEALRQLGKHVLTTGIDYTFQGYSFTFMDELLTAARNLPYWNECEMSTACAHCGKRAKGSRRYIVNNEGERRIAKRSDPFLMAGGNEYEAVCMQEHLSYDPD